MTPRRRARVFALQGVYQWLYTGNSASEIQKNLSEMERHDEADLPFLKAELEGTIAQADGLRERLEPLVDRPWKDVSPIERSILMIGAWELLHNPDVPYRVAINEAIELGKLFGGTDGHKYVNGVLDRLAADARPEEFARKGGTRRGA